MKRRISRKELERQIWVDRQLAMDLERIKAQRMLIGKPVRSIGQLTREIRNNPNWERIQRELLMINPKTRIKLDKKRLI